MITFGALIVAGWLGRSAPGIVEIGLGGDDIGRSTKKTLLGIMEALNDERFYAATARQIADSDMAIAVAKIKEYQFIRGIVFGLQTNSLIEIKLRRVSLVRVGREEKVRCPVYRSI